MSAAEVTVLGAGIAGLACAVACAARGLSVTVLEQAPALAEVGAGLQVAPNGGRVLDALGVEVPGVASRAVRLIDGPTGRAVIAMPLGPGFRLVHRADLIASLARRAAALGVTVRLGAAVAGIGAEGVRLASGEGVRAGRIVGADGARGAGRAHVAPGHCGAFTGQVAWRATVAREGWPAEAQVHMGPGRHLVAYPLRGGARVNVVAVEERAAWAAPGWSERGDPDALRAAFAGFAAPVRDLLAGVEATHLWGLMDHGMVPRWTRGAVTLIGDAAHPTLPFLAQGANLALEDAWTLAARLHDPDGWEAARRPRVARALAAAAGNARNYHLAGARRAVAHVGLRALARVAPGLPLRGLRWLYDADVTAG